MTIFLRHKSFNTPWPEQQRWQHQIWSKVKYCCNSNSKILQLQVLDNLFFIYLSNQQTEASQSPDPDNHVLMRGGEVRTEIRDQGEQLIPRQASVTSELWSLYNISLTSLRLLVTSHPQEEM